MINVDFNNRTGRKIRPMHGIGQPPILRGEPGVTPTLFHYLEEAGIPYSRLHDVAGSYGGADINRGEVILTDDEYLYTHIGDIVKNAHLGVKEHSMIEIRLNLV